MLWVVKQAGSRETNYPCWLMSESQKACSLWLPLKESQVLLALYKSCQEISSHQLCKEAVVPQLNNPPPHNKMLSLNPEEIFCLVTDLMCARRWWKHFFFPLQFEPLNNINCQDCDLQNLWDFDFFLLGGENVLAYRVQNRQACPEMGMCAWCLAAWSWESFLSWNCPTRSHCLQALQK